MNKAAILAVQFPMRPIAIAVFLLLAACTPMQWVYDPFAEEMRLTHFCLEAKGYRLVPIEPKK